MAAWPFRFIRTMEPSTAIEGLLSNTCAHTSPVFATIRPSLCCYTPPVTHQRQTVCTALETELQRTYTVGELAFTMTRSPYTERMAFAAARPAGPPPAMAMSISSMFVYLECLPDISMPASASGLNRLSEGDTVVQFETGQTAIVASPYSFFSKAVWQSSNESKRSDRSHGPCDTTPPVPKPTGTDHRSVEIKWEHSVVSQVRAAGVRRS